MMTDTEEKHGMNSKLFDFTELVKTETYGIKRYKNCLYKG
jgi:hypothetical protein